MKRRYNNPFLEIQMLKEELKNYIEKTSPRGDRSPSNSNNNNMHNFNNSLSPASTFLKFPSPREISPQETSDKIGIPEI